MSIRKSLDDLCFVLDRDPAEVARLVMGGGYNIRELFYRSTSGTWLEGVKRL